MSVPLRKSSTHMKDRQVSSIGGIRETSTTTPQLRSVLPVSALSQGRRDRRVTAPLRVSNNETIGTEKQNARRGSVLPQRRDVKSKFLTTEAVDGNARIAIDQSLVIKEDDGRQTTAEPTSSDTGSLIGCTSYLGRVAKKAPTAVAISSATVAKAMRPHNALGRSQSVRRPDAMGTSAMSKSQGERLRASVTTMRQASAHAALASHRRNSSLTKHGVQLPLRSVLGQASAAANQQGRSVSNACGSRADATLAIGCCAMKIFEDVKQMHAISSTQRASGASTGSVPPKSLQMPKAEDCHSRPRTRISSAPTGQPAKTQTKTQRPEFTTLQQHFTPKKSSKPPTASFFVRSPHRQHGADVISPETVSLQTELLQLHVLHQSSYSVQSQWERSAERVLRKRFETLVEQYVRINTKEHDAQECLNLLALMDWCKDCSSLQLAEKAQLLSQTIQDVQTMADPGGKYTRVVAVFEQWFSWSSQLLQSREEGQVAAGQEVEFVQDLGDGWKAELAVLERKLASTARAFSSLGPAPEGSSLAFILTSLRKMITAMQDEIATMRIIETQILTQEQAWVAGLLDELTSDISSDLIASDVPQRKGVWQEGG